MGKKLEIKEMKMGPEWEWNRNGTGMGPEWKQIVLKYCLTMPPK